MGLWSKHCIYEVSLTSVLQNVVLSKKIHNTPTTRANCAKKLEYIEAHPSNGLYGDVWANMVPPRMKNMGRQIHILSLNVNKCKHVKLQMKTVEWTWQTCLSYSF